MVQLNQLTAYSSTIVLFHTAQAHYTVNPYAGPVHEARNLLSLEADTRISAEDRGLTQKRDNSEQLQDKLKLFRRFVEERAMVDVSVQDLHKLLDQIDDLRVQVNGMLGSDEKPNAQGEAKGESQSTGNVGGLFVETSVTQHEGSVKGPTDGPKDNQPANASKNSPQDSDEECPLGNPVSDLSMRHVANCPVAPQKSKVSTKQEYTDLGPASTVSQAKSSMATSTAEPQQLPFTSGGLPAPTRLGPAAGSNGDADPLATMTTPQQDEELATTTTLTSTRTSRSTVTITLTRTVTARRSQTPGPVVTSAVPVESSKTTMLNESVLNVGTAESKNGKDVVLDDLKNQEEDGGGSNEGTDKDKDEAKNKVLVSQMALNSTTGDMVADTASGPPLSSASTESSNIANLSVTNGLVISSTPTSQMPASVLESSTLMQQQPPLQVLKVAQPPNATLNMMVPISSFTTVAKTTGNEAGATPA